MQLSGEHKEKIIEDLRLAMKRAGHGQRETENLTGVNQGQISRILRGDFQTRSPNVEKICEYADHVLGRDSARHYSVQQRLTDAVIEVWDGTDEGADDLLRLLYLVKKFTGATRHGRAKHEASSSP